MWGALHSAMAANQARKPVSAGTFRRVLDFARPHRRTIATYLGPNAPSSGSPSPSPSSPCSTPVWGSWAA